MKNKKIGVGIIGASAGSWAVRGHLPALVKLNDTFKVVAVSTTSQDSAQKTADEFKVPHAFDNENDLVAHPDVRLIVVAVKVPMHRHLIETALKAGKVVYSEWPLGNGTEEAKLLCSMAHKLQIKTFCGLQSRSLPEMKFIKDLIADHYLGEVLSVTVVGAGNNWGTSLPTEAMAYLLDPKNGATMTHIPFSHTLDGLQFCLGNFKEVAALLEKRNTEVLISDTGKTVPQVSNDQLLLMGKLTSGPIVSVHYRGGESNGVNLYWHIQGRKGELVISSPTGHLQFGKLRLQAAFGGKPLKDLAIPEIYRPTEGGTPGFDAELSRCLYYAYQEVAADINNGTTVFPTFRSAVERQMLLDDIESSAKHESTLTSTRTEL